MTAPRRHLVDHGFTWSPLNQPPVIVDRNAGQLIHNTATRDRVCIYGCGYGRREAPLTAPEWEVWGINTVPPLDPLNRIRADLWWDLHQRCAQSEQDLEWMRRLPMPIVVPPDLVDVAPHAVRFPIEHIETEVAPGLDPPFACTFAYQIAYALLVGYRHIGLFGVDLAFGDSRERVVEWPSVAWWIGYAEARGVTIHLPARSRLGRHPHRYGFDYHAEIQSTKDYVRWVAASEALAARRQEARRSVGG